MAAPVEQQEPLRVRHGFGVTWLSMSFSVTSRQFFLTRALIVSHFSIHMLHGVQL